jgi:hypothetical protein
LSTKYPTVPGYVPESSDGFLNLQLLEKDKLIKLILQKGSNVKKFRLHYTEVGGQEKTITVKYTFLLNIHENYPLEITSFYVIYIIYILAFIEKIELGCTRL